MRDLASVCTVESIIPMEGKDRIVCITFKENGYEVIVPKADTKIGDLFVFIQEGSILPETSTWEFLRKRCYKENLKGFLISPMIMGKKEDGTRVKSWGLAVKPEECGLTGKLNCPLSSGLDLTDALKIRKYEPSEDASPRKGGGKTKYPKWVKFCLSHSLTRWVGRIWQHYNQGSSGEFPSGIISKSDETTIQNDKMALEEFKDSLVYTSMKMEGQSATALFEYDSLKKKIGKFFVCSRNSSYKIPNDTIFWEMAKKYDLEKKIKAYYKKTGKLLVIQAEQCGPSIQSNPYGFEDNCWFVYTIKDAITKKQFTLGEMESVCKELGLKTVPIIEERAMLKEIMPNMESAVAYAENKFWTIKDGKYDFNYKPSEKDVLWKDYFQHEGVVVRTMEYDKDNLLGCSFKVKNSEYATKSLGEISVASKKLKG